MRLGHCLDYNLRLLGGCPSNDNLQFISNLKSSGKRAATTLLWIKKGKVETLDERLSVGREALGLLGRLGQ